MVKEDLDKIHRDQVQADVVEIVHLDFSKAFGKDSHYSKNK